MSTYDVEMTILGLEPKTISTLSVMSGNLLAQGIHGLLGRDVLADCRLTYAGPEKVVLLSF
jgi:hypothetical protein